jgi:SPP1 family predicted phage head-tail adaptor
VIFLKPFKYNPNDNSGTYRHKILIRKRTLIVDELLQEIESYSDYGKYWSMIKTIKGSEYISAAQEQFEKTVRFVVRYSKSLDAFIDTEKTSFEIVYKGVTYDVKDAVNDDEMNNTVTIVAESRV